MEEQPLPGLELSPASWWWGWGRGIPNHALLPPSALLLPLVSQTPSGARGQVSPGDTGIEVSLPGRGEKG